MKIIIVDDEEVIRDSILKFLKQKGYSCNATSSGKEALKIIEKEGADAVITDLNMPCMSGIELLRIIRNKYPKIKVIILTAFSNKEFMVAAKKYGAHGFFSKSEDLGELKTIIGMIDQTKK